MEAINTHNGQSLVEEVRNELLEIDSMETTDHAERYEQVHSKLVTALSDIDGLA